MIPDFYELISSIPKKFYNFGVLQRYPPESAFTSAEHLKKKKWNSKGDIKSCEFHHFLIKFLIFS